MELVLGTDLWISRRMALLCNVPSYVSLLCLLCPATQAQALEGRWAALNSSIEELRAERAEVLAAVSATAA